MYNVFIDGREGTTGLRIYERLSEMSDIKLAVLSEADRKNPLRRAEALNDSDLAFLCLPDEAAKESVSLVKNGKTRIIDSSTAHRVSPGWMYGFPELSAELENSISSSSRVAVPGCHASGFVSLVYPLVKAGLIPADTFLSAFSLTGYSGGGRKMIAAYESEDRPELYNAPRVYGLSQSHKHIPEMTFIPGLTHPPVFVPTVCDFYSGMEVTVPLFEEQLTPGRTVEDIKTVYRELYNNAVVKYCDTADEDGFASAGALSGSDSMRITVTGGSGRLLLISRFDNLGKGSSGAALQCMNLMLGRPVTDGLLLK